MNQPPLADLRTLCEFIRTPPMTVTELARWWGIGRRKALARLKHMPGIEIIGRGKGRRYCVPITRMPPGWWLAEGLIDVRSETVQNAQLVSRDDAAGCKPAA